MKGTSVKKPEKYLTLAVFKEHVGFVDSSFGRVQQQFMLIDERFDRIESGMTTILSEIQAMRQEAKEDRQTTAALSYNDLKQESAIEDLKERTLVLEKKPR